MSQPADGQTPEVSDHARRADGRTPEADVHTVGTASPPAVAPGGGVAEAGLASEAERRRPREGDDPVFSFPRPTKARRARDTPATAAGAAAVARAEAAELAGAVEPVTTGGRLLSLLDSDAAPPVATPASPSASTELDGNAQAMQLAAPAKRSHKKKLPLPDAVTPSAPVSSKPVYVFRDAALRLSSATGGSNGGYLYARVARVTAEGSALCYIEAFSGAVGSVTFPGRFPRPYKNKVKGEAEPRPNAYNLRVENWPPLPRITCADVCKLKVRLYGEAEKTTPRSVRSVYREGDAEGVLKMHPGSLPRTGHYYATLEASPVVVKTFGGDCDDHDGPLFELLAATVGAPPGVKFVRSSPTSAAHAWMRSVGGAVVRGAPSAVTLVPVNMEGALNFRLDATPVIFKLLTDLVSKEEYRCAAYYLAFSLGTTGRSFTPNSYKLNLKFLCGSPYKVATQRRYALLLRAFLTTGDIAIPNTPPHNLLSLRQPDVHAFLSEAAKLFTGEQPFCPLTAVAHGSLTQRTVFDGSVVSMPTLENPGRDCGIYALFRPDKRVRDFVLTADDEAALRRLDEMEEARSKATKEAEAAVAAAHECYQPFAETYRNALEIEYMTSHGRVAGQRKFVEEQKAAAETLASAESSLQAEKGASLDWTAPACMTRGSKERLAGVYKVARGDRRFRTDRGVHYLGGGGGDLYWHVHVPALDTQWSKDTGDIRHDGFIIGDTLGTHLDGTLLQPAFERHPELGVQLPLRFLENFTNTLGVVFALADDPWTDGDLHALASAAHVVKWFHKPDAPEASRRAFEEKVGRYKKKV